MAQEMVCVHRKRCNRVPYWPGGGVQRENNGTGTGRTVHTHALVCVESSILQLSLTTGS